MDGKTLEYKDIFDGQGSSICNLTLPNTSSGKSGLFGHTSENAMIKNLCIKGAKPNAQRKSDAGILVGYNKGYIINCSIQKSTVESNARSGGISGFFNRNHCKLFCCVLSPGIAKCRRSSRRSKRENNKLVSLLMTL